MIFETEERELSLVKPETELGYWTVGSGPPILVAGGLVGRRAVWKWLVEALGARHRFLGWDYRGLGRSARAGSATPMDIERHAADGHLVLEAAGADKAVVIGWSTGAQVAFELYRQAPERVAALVIICGTYGRAFEGALRWRGTRTLIPRAAKATTELHALVSSTLGRLAGLPNIVRYLKLTGAVGPTADEGTLHVMISELARVDPTAFMATVRGMGEHDATELLADIDVPVLIVAGDHDVLIPPRVAEKMARRIEGAELLVVPGGTHYSIIEHPELITLRVEKLLRDMGYGRSAADS